MQHDKKITLYRNKQEQRFICMIAKYYDRQKQIK